jgi:SAM-dependent MidA family methyltransferase
LESLIEVIRERGPLTVAAFMDLALYDPQFGYYARASRRSGHAGDFFTSVDVGAIFGELLEVQIAEMSSILAADHAAPLDLVDAGAGNGQLAADILCAARKRHPEIYEHIRLHLAERSAEARATQRGVLGEDAGRLVSSGPDLPAAFEGVLIANELLDALPVHQVVMREDGLREVYVDADRMSRTRGRLVIREGPLSTPALAEYLARLNVTLEPGWRVEINLNAARWIRDVAQRLTRGFIILIDYGHEARELYSVTHASGTLTTFAHHTAAGAESPIASVPWINRPGEQDVTAHVDFTSVRMAAEDAGLRTLGMLDQTYFLLGLADPGSLGSQGSLVPGANPENLENLQNFENLENLKKRLALKTLLLPGGLGSTMKVLILGKGVGTPVLRGCSYRMRVT